MGMSKGQMALEFVVLVAFLLFIFLGLFTLMSYRMTEVTIQKQDAEVRAILTSITAEIDIAQKTMDGYQRTFVLPLSAHGQEYSLEIKESAVHKELIITYADNKTVSSPLPDAVESGSTVGKGVNHLSRSDGKITLAHLS